MTFALNLINMLTVAQHFKLSLALEVTTHFPYLLSTRNETMSTQETFKAFTSQLESVTNPFYNFNQLVTKNIETLTKIQLDSLQAYGALGNESLQSLASLKQPQDIPAYGSKQMEVASKISQQLMEDSQKLTQLGQDFKSAADELTASAVKTAKSA